MSEPQAESAQLGDNDSWTGQRPKHDPISTAVSAAHLAGQLAMRERCAKGLPRAVAIGIYGIDSLYAKGWNDAVARAEELLRALSPEEHRT